MSDHVLTIRRLTKDIEAMARTYENYEYATMPGYGHLRLRLKDGTAIEVRVYTGGPA